MNALPAPVDLSPATEAPPSKPSLLFLSHCLPYPPDKGEKIRAHNFLKHVARTHRVHLGCLMTAPDDATHLETLRQWCETVAAFPIDRRRQKVSTLLRARPGRPLMLDYYRHPALHAWVRDTVAGMDSAFVYTVAMMPYLDGLRRPRTILDAADIDSEKWSTYANTAAFPMRHVWAREGRTLLNYERRVAMAADATLFVSPNESGRFLELAPETRGRVHAIENGVDLDRFAPAHGFPSPFDEPGPHLVFTGHMDYWPNADAVAWFVSDILPTVRRARPGARFTIVGANPGPDTLRLAERPGVQVTGRVPDVRPFVAHADVCVAPLRIARGIQNKVLEAMAMARPVVATPQAFEGVRATPGRDLLVADGAPAMAEAVLAVLDGCNPDMAANGRRAVEAGYAWSATLAPLDELLRGSAR